MANDDDGGIDIFELITAILLGLAAVGATWAAYQGDLWGGASVEGYAEANKQSTQAESAYNRAASDADRDTSLDIQAKQAILTALNTRDTDDGTRELNLTIAAYLYQHQLSEDGYKALHLPEGLFRGGDPEGAPAQTPPAAEEKKAEPPAEDTKPAEDMEPVEGDAPAPVAPPVPEADPTVLSMDQLVASLDYELGDDHWVKMVEPTLELSEASEARFKQGQEANETGDKFGLSSVVYALCLFIAGVGLVVKGKVKWGFAGAGAIAFAIATFLLFKTPWAG